MRVSELPRSRRVFGYLVAAVVLVMAATVVTGRPAHAAAGNHNMTPTGAAWSQCLDIRSNAPGTNVWLWNCQVGNPSQEWWWNDLSPSSAQDHVYLVASASSSYRMCWDLNSYDVGTPVILNYCDSRLASQRWAIKAYDFDRPGYRIVSVGSNWYKCLDLRSYATGTRVELNWCDDSNPSQRWLWRWTS